MCLVFGEQCDRARGLYATCYAAAATRSVASFTLPQARRPRPRAPPRRRNRPVYFTTTWARGFLVWLVGDIASSLAATELNGARCQAIVPHPAPCLLACCLFAFPFFYIILSLNLN